MLCLEVNEILVKLIRSFIIIFFGFSVEASEFLQRREVPVENREYFNQYQFSKPQYKYKQQKKRKNYRLVPSDGLGPKEYNDKTYFFDDSYKEKKVFEHDEFNAYSIP
jgi:hypothetical protein